MARIPRQVAQELIKYVKRLDVKFNYWDEGSRSANEFARQMDSPKLRKINPTFEFSLDLHDKKDPAVVIAEFLDGSKWQQQTAGFKASDLRSEFYSKAAEAEDSIERSGGSSSSDTGDDGNKKGGKGKK